MEVLNFSLWFTLVWWVLLAYILIGKKEIRWFSYINDLIAIPAIAILLEYLIMR